MQPEEVEAETWTLNVGLLKPESAAQKAKKKIAKKYDRDYHDLLSRVIHARARGIYVVVMDTSTVADTN